MGTYTSKHNKNIKFSEEASEYFKGADVGATVTVRTNTDLKNDDISDTMRNLQYSGFTLDNNNKLYEDDFSILKLNYTNTYYFDGYEYKASSGENWNQTSEATTHAITSTTGSYLAKPVLRSAFNNTAITFEIKTFTRQDYDNSIITESHTFSENDLHLDNRALTIANTGFTYHYDSINDKTTVSCSEILNSSNLDNIKWDISFKDTYDSWVRLAEYTNIINGQWVMLNETKSHRIKQENGNIRIIVTYQNGTQNKISTTFSYTAVGETGETVYITLAKNGTNNGYWYNNDFPGEEVTRVELTAGTQYTISNDTEKKVIFGTNSIYKYHIDGDYMLDNFSASTGQSFGTITSDMTITANLHSSTCEVFLNALPLRTAKWIDGTSTEFPRPLISSFTVPYGTNWNAITINDNYYTVAYDNIYAEAIAADNCELSKLTPSGTGKIVSNVLITAITKQKLTVKINTGVAKIDLTYHDTDNIETSKSITSDIDVEIYSNSSWSWEAVADSGYIMDTGSNSGSGSGKGTISPTAHQSQSQTYTINSGACTGCSITSDTGTFGTEETIRISSIDTNYDYPISYDIKNSTGEVLDSGTISSGNIRFTMTEYYYNTIYVFATATYAPPTPTTHTITFAVDGGHGSWDKETIENISYNSHLDAYIGSGRQSATVEIDNELVNTFTISETGYYNIDQISPSSIDISDDRTITAYVTPTPTQIVEPPTVSCMGPGIAEVHNFNVFTCKLYVDDDYYADMTFDELREFDIGVGNHYFQFYNNSYGWSETVECNLDG